MVAKLLQEEDEMEDDGRNWMGEVLEDLGWSAVSQETMTYTASLVHSDEFHAALAAEVNFTVKTVWDDFTKPHRAS